ncbi:MAG TPA: MATE family efflux transporter [Tepidisphaeraceae bacterium]|nr:MATE family efflux transporter [Tepidisphaeraceae bacterium]
MKDGLQPDSASTGYKLVSQGIGTPATLARRTLLAELLLLALPMVAENILHMLVGLTDVYLASHLPTHAAPATAAVGSISYVLWLIGLIAGAIGTGSTAIIARAIGAKHQSLANSVCGQSVTAAILTGALLSIFFLLFAQPCALLTGLGGDAYSYALFYIRILGLSLPFSILMYAASAALRGAGDSLTPAISMIVVDVVNMGFSTALSRGWWGFPALGFRGIAIGTVIAYFVGGVLLFVVLLRGRGRLRLYTHRLRPHWLTLKRIFRIGIPSGTESLLAWMAQFLIIIVINRADPTNVMAAAHIIAVRVEALSYLVGYAVATAAATLVGQALGRRDEPRARQAAYLCYAVGGGAMALGGVVFICFGRILTGFMSDGKAIADLAAGCLFITAFAQPGFAAAMIFAGALRGAGDTFWVMVLNLASILGVRLPAALAVGWLLHLGLIPIWIVLATELNIRGLAVYMRFWHGGWRHVKL